MDKYDVAILVLRVSFGLSLCAHGWNKIFSPNGLAGTANWFSSIGMKWPHAQARVAAGVEVATGLCLAVGLCTTLACSAVMSLMVVAIVTVHWRVGYFIFLPNGGWEYCASIIAVSVAVAVTGPGLMSLDDLWGLSSLHPIAVIGLGVVAPVCHLALSYRPGGGPPAS